MPSTLEKHVGAGRLVALREELKRLEDELRIERGQRAKVEKQLYRTERVRDFLFEHTRSTSKPPRWANSRAKVSKGKSPHVSLLFLSDFQWGEVIDRDQIGGVNEFNKDVARESYRVVVERAVDISLNHLPRNEYDGLVLLRGGDMVSGSIHFLNESNDLTAIEACRDLAAVEREGIEKLASAFGKVWVISVPGNHGRTTEKPRSKGGTVDNYDTLLAWWLESLFAADDRVTFWTPDSGDAVFKVYGRNYLLTHGDRIGSRGGEGFVGPAATIARGMKRTMDSYAKLGTIVEKVFCGHFHTALELEQGFANGSLPGYSEYARDGRMTPSAPVQWLFQMHRRYGITSRWPIVARPAPQLPTSEMRVFGGEVGGVVG